MWRQDSRPGGISQSLVYGPLDRAFLSWVTAHLDSLGFQDEEGSLSQPLLHAGNLPRTHREGGREEEALGCPVGPAC